MTTCKPRNRARGRGRGGWGGKRSREVTIIFFIWTSTALISESSSSLNRLFSRERIIQNSARSDLGSGECSGTPCTCTKVLKIGEIWADWLLADCSGKNLTRIPLNLPTTIITLNLSNNILESVEYEDLKTYIQLRVLDLSFNSIATIAKNAFMLASRLQNLYLHSNNLSARNNSLPFSVFGKLTSLITLTLHDNPRFANAVEYRDDLFVELINLQSLTIDGVPMAEFGKGFSKLINLKRLEIHNNLTCITNKTFQQFANLPIQQLNIKTGTFLQALEQESFAHFYNLSVLDLSYNRGLDLTKVSAAWYGLQNTTIQELILTRIIPFDMQTTNIDESFYKYLDKTKIQRISIDRNNIVQTYPGLSNYLPHVTHLDMSYNRLSNVGSLIADFGKMRQLKILDASNQIKRYNDIAKRHVTNVLRTARNVLNGNMVLKDKDFSHCHEMTPTGNALCPTIHFNKNGTYPMSDEGPWCFILAPRLETFNLSASLSVNLQFMPQLVALGGHRLKEFIYRANGISFFTGPIIMGYPNFSIPLSVDLSDNGFECISPDVFKYMIQRGARIDKLAFSNNNLYAQLEQDVAGDVFKYYTHLTQLHLDRNGIKSLQPGIFRHLSALELLNLSGNSMRLLEFEFSHMKHLQLLDISNNLIISIDSDTLNKIDEHIQASNMSLNLCGNPIQCSCDTLPFLTWMQANNELLVDFSTYSCMYKGNPHMSFRELEHKILVELHLLCSTKTALWVSASLLGLAIVAVFLSVVAYRHRWDIRYYLLRLRNDRRVLIDIEERSKQYKYDAFVIYDHRDIHWVKHELDTKLGRCTEIDEAISFLHTDEMSIEGEQEQFRFCIHDRDFEAGAHINENIYSAIRNSRKMVLIITSNILSSPWCQYELHLAISENVQRGFNTIVPIMLEPLDDISVMSSNMQHMVRSLTYIQWPQDEDERPQFWRQLKDALRR